MRHGAALLLLLVPALMGAGKPLKITTTALPAATAGAAYSQTLAAMGGTTPYTWSVSVGTLPAGLTLSGAGVISGTPTRTGASSFTVAVQDVDGTIDTQPLNINVGNSRPAITTTSLAAGTSGTAYSGTLSASGTVAPVTWTVSAGALPAGLTLGASTGAITGTPTAAGTANFTARVADNAGGSDTQALSLLINPPPLNITTTSLPAATAGSAYSAGLSAAGGTTPYAWTISAGTLPAGLTLSGAGTISGTPTAAGSSNFTVRVTDNGARTTTAGLSIAVSPAALSINGSPLPQATLGTPYSQSLNAVGGTPPFTWTLSAGTLPAGLTLSAGGTISGTPTALGPSNFTVKVTDSGSRTDTSALSITVAPATLLVTTSSLPPATAGTAYSQGLNASGGTTPYTWTVSVGTLPAGLALSSSGTISGTPTTAGTSNFTVKVTDNAAHTATAPLSLTVNPAAVSITTSTLSPATVGTLYSQTLNATGGTPPYVWLVTAGSLPLGLALSPTGLITGIPLSAGPSNFTVKATDLGNRSDTAALSLTVNAGALNITTSSLAPGIVGTVYSQVLNATGGTTPYTWTISVGTLPAGLTLSAAGTISGTPTAAGTSNFTVKVTDNAAASTTAPLSITINAASLNITTPSLPPGAVGTPYSQGLNATGGTSPYSWNVSAGTLPAGLTLSATGTISGTPTAAGTSNFTVRVTDNAAASTTAPLSITINAASLNITTTSLPPGAVGTPYSQGLNATGGTSPYSWNVSAGTLPAGLALSAAGTISGTPTTAGTSNFTVRVTDNASTSTTAALSITIGAASLHITTSLLPPGAVAASYSQGLSASGGTSPYSWTVSAGSLPAGLTLSAAGTISGTPTTAGTSNFTAKVTDNASVSTTAGLSLTIGPAALSINNSSLPPGTVGTAYSQSLGASGGTPPYSWTVSAGSLPAGLNLSAGGVVSGTPTNAGPANVTVKVTDSASVSTTAALTMNINPPGLGISTFSLPQGAVGTNYSQGLGATGGTPPYSWSMSSGSLPSGLNLSADGTISGTPATAGTSNFTVRVTDAASVAVSAGLSLTVNPPTLNITTSALPNGTVGTAYSQTLAGAGGSPPYSWTLSTGSLPAGLSLSANGVVSGTPTTAGSSGFSVKITDSASVSTTAALSLAIGAAALGVTTSTMPAGSVGLPYSQPLNAAGGSPPYTWAVSGGSLPSGLSLSATGSISGTPTIAGSSSFSVRVTDSASVTATATLQIAVNPPGLSITTTALPTATVGSPYQQPMSAVGGTSPYGWSLASGALPPGLTMNAAGTVSGTPTNAGAFTFSPQVTDGAGVKAVTMLVMQVQTAPLIITTTTMPASTVGANYNQALTATGGTPPLTWTLNSGSLPPGITLDSGGAVRGTPTTAGSYTFTLQAADNSGLTAQMNYSLTVNAAVKIETTSVADALISAPYTQSLRASGGSPPYTWSVTSGQLPTGIKLDSAAGTLSGTPTAVGTFNFTLRAVDSVSAFAERAYQITTAAGLIITTAPTLPPATSGVQYNQALDAEGGRPPYIWSISSGGLPAGVTLNSSTGVLGGVPSAAGSFQFTVDVSDSLARKASKTFTLTVASTLLITSAPALPSTTTGDTYSQTLAATGGTPPYTWSITAGGLPPGLAFDAASGTISGSPTAGGSFQFTIQTLDSNSVTATKQFTLTVTSNLSITTASDLADATAGVPYGRSLSATGGVAPYTFSVAAGSLPPGITLDDATSTITGTPSAGGTFTFTLQVTDAGGASATRDFTITVTLPPMPSVSIDGLPDPANPADQPFFTVSVATPYPVQLTGQVVMSFTPDAAVPVDDTSIQFATGGRTVNFTIPAGSTNATFATPRMALQTGTVAGTISLNMTVQTAASDRTATASRTMHVLRAAPVMRATSLVHTATGFEVHITGYSTPRQLTQAVVVLTPSPGSNLQTTQLTIPLSDLAGTWYQNAASNRFGSQFTLVLPFTIQGNASVIGAVGVSLANDQGSSSMVTSQF